MDSTRLSSTASVLCSARPFSLPALFHLGHKRARLTNNEIRPTARPSFQLWRPSEPAGGYRTLSPDWFALCRPTEAKPFIKDTVREAKKGKMVVGYSVGYGFEKLSLEDKISTEWKQISQC